MDLPCGCGFPMATICGHLLDRSVSLISIRLAFGRALCLWRPI